MNEYNLYEKREYREGREIKRMRGDCECEGKREKNKEREEKRLFISKTYVTYIR